MREIPLIKVFDGKKLVGLTIHRPTATSSQPDNFELEIVRIFEEYKQLQAENKRLEEAIEASLRIKKLWLPKGVYGAATKDEQAALCKMHTMFEQALKGEK